MICSVFYDEQGKLPQRRSDLYRKGLKDFLEKLARPEESRHRGCDALDLDGKLDLLGYLAYTLFEENDYFPIQGKLEKLISDYLYISKSEATQILRSLEAQHGIFIERSEGYFSFSHLTFQEYFTARYVAGHQELLTNILKYVDDSRWREVFLLLIEILDSEDTKLCSHLLEDMKNEIDTILAKDPKLQEFLKWVHQKSQYAPQIYLPESIRAFYYVLTYDSPGYGYEISIEKQHESSIFDLDLTLWSSICFMKALTSNDEETVNNVFQGDFFNWNRGLAIDLGFTPGIAVYLTNRSDYMDMMFDTIPPYLERALRYAHQHDLDALADTIAYILYSLHSQNLCREDRTELQARMRIWKKQGEEWLKELQQAAIEHQHIGRDWQHSSKQKKLLRDYFYANRILVDCMKNVSEKLREEITSTLILPIAEIEKRKAEKAQES